MLKTTGRLLSMLKIDAENDWSQVNVNNGWSMLNTQFNVDD